MSVGGFVLFMAMYLINMAVNTGKGAIAMAISQTSNFFWLIFDMVLNLRMPFLYEMIAMVIGLIGATIIALAKK